MEVGQKQSKLRTVSKSLLTEKQKRYLPFKRTMDLLFSGGALLVLSPLFLIIAAAIKLESKGPILFRQKRVGKDRQLFEIWKFRSMRADTPKDLPTHLLDNPQQYITKSGSFLRRTSLDELPQLVQIFTGKMSIIGPRPALWNQDDLVREREKYGANSVTPGLTGWAQINGRDELEIPLKARYDGEYVRRLGFWMDLKCFLGTIKSVLGSDGVVEGGTGSLHKNSDQNKTKRCRPRLAPTKKRNILITGAGSYIGQSVEGWLLQEPEAYRIATLDMQSEDWRETDFSAYDVVFHVAGIAHADVEAVSEETKQLYYNVNTRLALETARRAKAAGVKQFIFMSSMMIYSGCNQTKITRQTHPKPLNFYGNSKWQADRRIGAMASDEFKVVILRPPMIYGKGSKGNYPKLAALAGRLLVFPLVKNKRSVLHIDHLCEFVRLMIDREESGVFFPQNREYASTSQLVKLIAEAKGRNVLLLPGTSWMTSLAAQLPGKIGMLAAKAFGDACYEMEMSDYPIEYRLYSLRQSIHRTEGNDLCPSKHRTQGNDLRQSISRMEGNDLCPSICRTERNDSR